MARHLLVDPIAVSVLIDVSGSRSRSPRRSLWPREHGAYVQLLAPLATALFGGAVAPAALAHAVAASAGFLVHEPLLIVLGARGARTRAHLGRAARKRTWVLGGVGGALAGLGLVLAPHAATVAVLVALPASASIVFAIQGRAHTLAGELVAVVALTGAAVPVAVAAGTPAAHALVVWGAWTLAFGASVVAVHRVLACHRRRAPRARALTLGFVALVAVAVAVVVVAALAHERTRLLTVAPIAPMLAVAAAVVAAPPSARHLREVGIALTLAAVLAVVGMVAGAP